MEENVNAAHESYHVVHFCDVHHFTDVAVELGPRVPLFIDDFYTRMGEIVVSQGGQIVGYCGDCIFFLYCRTGHLAAVKSALLMRTEYTNMLSTYGVQSKSELENGLSAGMVSMRVVGHATHRVNQIFGEAVNEASFLGCHQGVAFTAPVKEAIQSRHEVRQLPDMHVKWSSRPLEVWELKDPNSLP